MARAGNDPFVERVREVSDIVEVIGAHVQLKKMGSRLGGLCPFHREKTPSFYVNPAMQAFHCFGCGAGGDVFAFLMQFEKMSFPEALRFLAERAGIPLPDRRGPATDLLQRIREALALARSWYAAQLAGPAGSEARIYLERRGIGAAMRESYGLGFVPDQWDGLLRHARSLLSERTLIEAGLAIESSGGRIYDRFRHRLMIPIETAAGTTVGFGGRALGDEEAKYLNSPETPVYRKGSVLFGIPAAREGVLAEGRVVVVEGYFDVIALVQAGIPGVVGTCGTALTQEQGALLRRLASRAILLFDGDSAGRGATLRALPILAGELPDLRVATPPPGKDPDLWVREEGADAVREALAHARTPLAYLEELAGAGALGMRDAADRAAEMISRIADPMARDLWLQEAVSRFGIRAEAFLQAARMHEKRFAAQQDAGTTGSRDAGPGEGRAAGSGSPRAPLDAFARECLRSALAHPARSREIAAALEASGVEETLLVRLLTWIAGLTEAEGISEPAAILSRAIRELPEAKILTSLTLGEGGPPVDPVAILLRIEQRGVRRRMEGLNREIRRAQEAGNPEEIRRFLIEKDRLARLGARLSSTLSSGSWGNPAAEE